MNKREVKIIENEEYFLQIINELRNEYGTKRKGDTYMDEDRLQREYTQLKNKELEVAGVFLNTNTLAGFVSYKITDEGLYVGNILVFQNYRGRQIGTLLVKHIEKYAKQNNCKQIYLGARRTANDFYFKQGFEGSCLIQSSKATKEDLERLMEKYNIVDYSYNLYEGCYPPVNQIRVDAKYFDNEKLIEEIDNSVLDIGCILTFSKKIQ